MTTDLVTNQKISLYNGLGFVELVDMMPRLVPTDRTADLAISRNARVSYAAGDKTPAQDASLVRYLTENYHSSPSESVVFQFRIRLPIFVERQLIRHRTARVNEQSHRYTTATDEFYYPALRMSAGSITPALTETWQKCEEATRTSYQLYTQLVDGGVAREVARCTLPVCMMTEMMWQNDLNNLMGFLRLRMAATAQQEIRELACAIHQIVLPLVPVSMQAFDDFRLNAVTFDVMEQQHIQGKSQLQGRKLDKLHGKLDKIGLQSASF